MEIATNERAHCSTVLGGPIHAPVILLREFAGGGSDGHHPDSSLALSGSTLYGMTSGDDINNLGTVFTLGLARVPVSSSIAPLALGASALVARRRR